MRYEIGRSAMSKAASQRQSVSPGLLWFSRIMSWLCWAGIAWTIIFAALQMFGVLPRAPANSDGLTGSASVPFGVHDPPAPRPPIPDELLNDPLYIASGLIAPLLTVWALVSAHSVFANIGRGQFFARPTSLGLRNLSVAVLL